MGVVVRRQSAAVGGGGRLIMAVPALEVAHLVPVVRHGGGFFSLSIGCGWCFFILLRSWQYE